MCPSHSSEDHFIKMKNLITLNLTVGSDGKEFVCAVCKKTLNQQKIATLRKCGHTMCLDCIKQFSLPEKACSECSIKLKKKDVIPLEESGTAFAAHNKVEAERYIPSFNA